MTLYVDIGVVRIQEYITRTSGSDEHQLRKRRGASRMVTEATDVEAFASLGFIKNPETYTAEGVDHLQRSGGSQTDPLPQIPLLVAQVQHQLPHAYVEASWCEAGTYREAHDRIRRVRERGELAPNDAGLGLIRAVPAFREDAHAGRCMSCGLGTAVQAGTCPDCSLRDAKGKNDDKQGRKGKNRDTAESRALAKVAELTGQMIVRPRDLNTVAKLPRGGDAKRNHLATIYADGNAVGALFDAITDSEVAIEVSGAIDAAIRDAGATALASVVDSCRTQVVRFDPKAMVLPGVVTVLAADDVLITVPASFGWRVATTLVRTFNESVERVINEDHAIRDLLRTSDLAMPTLTAGMCFHHVKSPMESAIRAADAAMREAKKAARRKSSIGWTDQTHPAPSILWKQMDWLTQKSGWLNEVAAIPGHQRAKWERDIETAVQREIDDARVLDFLRAEATRLGVTAFEDSALDVPSLRSALALTRWWGSGS